MLSDRSYRAAATAEQALRELGRMAGRQFDPVVVAALEAHLGVEAEPEAGNVAQPVQLVA